MDLFFGRKGDQLNWNVADLCFLASCGIAVENKEVWLAAERESINPAAANGERFCRVALLKDKNGATHYSKFSAKISTRRKTVVWNGFDKI